MLIERISRQQLIWLYANLHLGIGILFMPSILVGTSKQDAWITVLVSATVAAGMVWIWTTLTQRFWRMTPAQYLPLIFGRPIGLGLLLLIEAYFIWLSAVILREFVDFFNITYPETPTVFMVALVVGVCLYALRLGLEGIARINDLLFTVIAGGSLFIIALALPKYSATVFQPILQQGWKPILAGVWIHSSFPYGDAAFFLMIFPFLRNKKDLRKTAFAGLGIGASFIFLWLVTAMMVLGPSSTARIIYPSHVVARNLSIAGFLGGLDGLIDIVWIASTVVELCSLLFALSVGMSGLLGLKSYRDTAWPVCLIVGVYSLFVFRNFTAQINFDKQVFPYMSLTISVVIPALSLLVAVLRGLKGPTTEDQAGVAVSVADSHAKAVGSER